MNTKCDMCGEFCTCYPYQGESTDGEYIWLCVECIEYQSEMDEP